MGYIHRDIKPSNFVIGKGRSNNKVYLVDFGLSKIHLNELGVPDQQRKNADFRGTIAYASLNAHNKIVFVCYKQDLSRRDDLWSWYFVVLDFFNEELEWRTCKSNKMDEVKVIKAKCLSDPENNLWKTTTKGIPELKQIYYSISKLGYPDKPDYEFIRTQLKILLQKEELKEQLSFETRESSGVYYFNDIQKKRKCPSVIIIDSDSVKNLSIPPNQQINDNVLQIDAPVQFGFPYTFLNYPLCPNLDIHNEFQDNEELKEGFHQGMMNHYIQPNNRSDYPIYYQTPQYFGITKETGHQYFKIDVNKDYYMRLYDGMNENLLLQIND